MPSLVERLNRLHFRRVVKNILLTPPVPTGRHAFTALSMVHHRDVLAYLLAIKSFALHAQPERIVVIADPSIDDSDAAALKRHVPSVELLSAVKFRRPALPVGGTWERLSAISTLNAESSILQLDSDTITCGVPTEVISSAVDGRSFIIRSEANVEIMSLDAAATLGKTLLASSHHIQAVTESRLGELADSAAFRYVRGCSGFTGFGRDALTPDRLDQVSIQMRTIHGSRWDEWGTEQVTSNLLAASSPGAFMLPHPRYCNADTIDTNTILAHFIGYARHTTREYEYRANAALRELSLH